jgi:hypothetical protein
MVVVYLSQNVDKINYTMVMHVYANLNLLIAMVFVLNVQAILYQAQINQDAFVSILIEFLIHTNSNVKAVSPIHLLIRTK